MLRYRNNYSIFESWIWCSLQELSKIVKMMATMKTMMGMTPTRSAMMMLLIMTTRLDWIR